MTTKATAAVFYEPDGKFSFETIELDDLRSDEILVRIEACGVCHTDTMARKLTPLPAVFGHEGTGVVEAIGSGINRVRPGDRVIISYPWCGSCPSCLEGRAYICEHSFPLAFGGARLDGSKTISVDGKAISSAFFQQSSFASHAIALERNVIPVQSGQLPEMLAAIPCGVQTGAGAVLNIFNAGPKDGLAVFGAGSVGLSAVMAGHLVGASPLIVVDVVEERLNLALELGATHAFNAKEGDIARRIREVAPRGLEFAFDSSANEQALNDAIECLCNAGRLGMVTAPRFGDKFPFTPWGLVLKGATLHGIIQGSAFPRTFLPKLLELHQQGRFPYDRLVKTYDFMDIDKAFEDAKNGVTIKPVLKMSQSFL